MELNEKQVVFTYKPDFDYNNLDQSLFKPHILEIENVDQKVEDEYNYWKVVGKELISNKTLIFSVILLIFILLLVTFVPMFVPISTVSTNKVSGISWRHMFGINNNNRDFFVLLCDCTGYTLIFGFWIVFLQLTFGFIFGIAWSFIPRIDYLMHKITKIMNIIPKLMWCIIILFLFKIGDKGNISIVALYFAYTSISWSSVASEVNNRIASDENRNLTLSSKVLGTKNKKIFFKNIFPNLLPIIFKSIYVAIPEVLMLEVTFDYINFGYNETNFEEIKSLGQLLAAPFLDSSWTNNPWWIIIPVVSIMGLLGLFYYVFKTISNAFELKLDKKN